MLKKDLPLDLNGKKVYFIGIKGTGMTALAEIFQKKGAYVFGSDTEEKFYTDDILNSLGIPFTEGFSKIGLPEEIDIIVHSAAYTPENNTEMAFSSELNIPVLEYTEALGNLSRSMFSCGITGVHGKTTTTSIAGSLLKYLELPGTALVGSGVAAFDGKSSYTGGSKYFIAETCEYKRHFLNFHPKIIVLTNIEKDHMDYYKDYDDIENAFISYMKLLPPAGKVIYCGDDAGAENAVEKMKLIRPDLKFIEYGESAEGPYKIKLIQKSKELNSFTLSGFKQVFSIKIPGRHIVLDAAAAIIVILSILEEENSFPNLDGISSGLLSFGGSKRRLEYKGEYRGIIIMDDYGHHPTEISATLKGLREFYTGRRIVVDFMSHTYSRTLALFDSFSSCFTDADVVIFHKIYSSAREKEQMEKKGTINGKNLYEAASKYNKETYYFHEIEDSYNFYLKLLQKNDLFITIGAGNNWIIGDKLIKNFKEDI